MSSEIEEQKKKYNGQPSIESSDPNERKLARRLRIRGRLAAAEKLKAIADGTYVEPEPEKPLLDETIETSEDTLRQLYNEGKELVSNIMVASDAKEVERRENELREKNDRIQKLKEESCIALEKLVEISKKWETILDAKGPLELHAEMKEQKAKCLDLIEQKNELIKGFQLELKIADEKFMKERKAMFEELSLLCKRIDEQVLLMKRAYRIEIENIEEAVDVTRTQILEKHEKIWQNLYQQREKEEKLKLTKKFDLVETFHEDLHKRHTEHEEKYRETRIQLENDVQTLEQELEQVRALCLLNSEKLDYNYQVLKKREEENIYIKNHQKRRLNKLQDMVNTLKKKTEEKKQSVEEEYKRLTKDVERYHANVLETEEKGNHFAQVNDEKFLSIWEMKEEETRELVEKILAADMVIQEQILGLPWTRPVVSFPNKMDTPSYKTALVVVKDLNKKKKGKEKEEEKQKEEKPEKQVAKAPLIMEGHKRLLRHIMGLIADHSGFLMEDKLDDLLKPYTEYERTFVRLDNVFAAIGINGENDMEVMKRIFYPYTICLVCEIQMSEMSVINKTEKNEPRPGDDSRQHSILHIRELEEKVSKLRIQAKSEALSDSSGKQSGVSNDLQGRMSSLDPRRENLESSFQTKRSTPESKDELKCNITHPLLIEKHCVLKALKDFVTFYHSERCKLMSGINEILSKQRYTISRLLSKDDVNTFWEKYNEILPPRLDSMWTGIYLALSRYLTVLQERHELNLKAKALRRENLDLKRMFVHYKISDKSRNYGLPIIPSAPDEPIDPKELAAIVQKLDL